MNGRGIWGQRGGIDTEGWVRMEGGNGGSGEASTHRGACCRVRRWHYKLFLPALPQEKIRYIPRDTGLV